MRIILPIILSVLTILFCESQGFSQPGNKSPEGKFKNAGQQEVIEKAYLHFDRPFYYSSDTIWFKAYLVDADNRLTENSQLLYVELIDPTDRVIRTLKVPLSAGLGWSDIPLEANTASGSYRIRAYTNWMRNYDNSGFFTKEISVVNILSSDIKTKVDYKRVGDEVQAQLSFKDLKGEPLARRQVYHNISGRQQKGTTDDSGKVILQLDTNRINESRTISSRIINGADTVSKTFSIPKLAPDFHVAFFPESGNLVANIPSRLAFKVVGSDGLGLDATGYIVDSSNSRIAEFETAHLGMGVVGINPMPNMTYTAHIVTGNGLKKTITLPVTSLQGYVLTLNRDGANLAVRVRISEKLFGGGNFSLVVRKPGNSQILSRTAINKSSMVVRIPREVLLSGIIEISLYENERAVAERVAFVHNQQELNISLSPINSSYEANKPLTLKLDAKNANGVDVLANFSIAIVDEDLVKVDEESEVSIVSNLQLTSVLKGYVERPQYYFLQRSELKEQHLDLLMMTQGWRRLINTSPTFTAEKGTTIKGKVVRPFGGPVPGSLVSLIIQGSGEPMIQVKADENGSFAFENLNFEGERNLVFSAYSADGKSNVKVVIDTTGNVRPAIGPRQYIPSESITDSILQKGEQGYLSYLKRYQDVTKSQLLQEVVVKATATRKIPNSKNLNNRDVTYSFPENQFGHYINLADLLQAKITGLVIQTNARGERTAKTARSMSRLFRGAPPMMIYLDGVPTGHNLNEFNLADFEGVEVLTEDNELAIYGAQGGGGIILLTSRATGPKIDPPMNVSLMKMVGMAPRREFYSPLYRTELNPPSNNNRATIYWNPSVFTNSVESNEFTFVTGIKPGKYRIVIEGVDENGNLGSKVFTSEVK
ncbi:MG2 domain-containing protein [Daejeonella lutea]|uniref:Macroglobulin domain-containing protein n=1 Tax=Daejeonella lutea TaxID=572036 RepID=A0A1T5EZR0_9SPHI|nr:MG2 domain-containing protein [Daejeonella lutea]SKB89423.1 hypothetical protein SAMN05661099_3336 [Daejeonella lutea]